MAFQEVGSVSESRVFRVDAGIYLVRLGGHLTLADSDALNDVIARDSKLERRAVLYEVSAAFTGYDPALRKANRTTLVRGTALIGIVTTNTMLRLVAATVALAVRATSGVTMKTYNTVDAAIADARDVMARAR
jgi:hypothetical protein